MLTNISNASSNHQNSECTLTSLMKESFSVKISRIFFLAVILTVALIGNSLIIITVYKRKELRKTVNYFIVNMAISDFIFPLTNISVALRMAATSSLQWPFRGTTGLILCKLQYFVQNVSLSVSVQSLLWITLDRFLAVVFPMKINLMSSKFRVFAVASTWIVAVIINSTDFNTTVLVEYHGDKICTEDKTSLVYKNSTYVRFAFLWIAPLIVTTILYCAIVVSLRRQDKVLGYPGKAHRVDRKKRQAIKMSLSIMITFYLFAFILLTIVIFQFSGKWKSLEVSPTFCSVYGVLWFVAHLGIYLSSTSNPIICFIFVESYRRGLKEIFCSRQSKRLKAGNVETGKHDDIALKRFKPWKIANERI